jgi:bacillithiol system protein YtxJ
MPGREFTQLTKAEALDGLLARSHAAPVLLFLHDDFCPISGAAYAEMRELPDPDKNATLLVDVHRDHAISRAIEARTGVRHESPQVIILRHGRTVWDASHFDITAQAVKQAVAENS